MSKTDWLIYAAAVVAMAGLYWLSANALRRAVAERAAWREEVDANNETFAEGVDFARQYLASAHPECETDCPLCDARNELIGALDDAIPPGPWPTRIRQLINEIERTPVTSWKRPLTGGCTKADRETFRSGVEAGIGYTLQRIRKELAR